MNDPSGEEMVHRGERDMCLNLNCFPTAVELQAALQGAHLEGTRGSGEDLLHLHRHGVGAVSSTALARERDYIVFFYLRLLHGCPLSLSMITAFLGARWLLDVILIPSFW